MGDESDDEFDPAGATWVPMSLADSAGEKTRIRPNTVVAVDNELFSGIYCGLVRPSHNASFEKRPYVSKPCFENRKRLWELLTKFRHKSFLQPPT